MIEARILHFISVFLVCDNSYIAIIINWEI